MDNSGRGNAAKEDGGRNKEVVNLDNLAEGESFSWDFVFLRRALVRLALKSCFFLSLRASLIL